MAKLVVITGGNRGIGLALVKCYLSQGYDVVATCRQSNQVLDNSGAQVVAGVDVSDSASLIHLVQALGSRKVDILINNAGVLDSETLGSIDYEALARQININSMGPIRVTETLLDHLSLDAKVGLITSRMGSISDNSSGGYYGYRMSKAALNAAGVSLARDLSARGISVAILHPGFVQTEMVDFGGDISADEAAQRLALRISELNLENSGTFWHSNGEVLPW